MFYFQVKSMSQTTIVFISILLTAPFIQSPFHLLPPLCPVSNCTLIQPKHMGSVLLPGESWELHVSYFTFSSPYARNIFLLLRDPTKKLRAECIQKLSAFHDGHSSIIWAQKSSLPSTYHAYRPTGHHGCFLRTSPVLTKSIHGSNGTRLWQGSSKLFISSISGQDAHLSQDDPFRQHIPDKVNEEMWNIISLLFETFIFLEYLSWHSHCCKHFLYTTGDLKKWRLLSPI